MAEAITKHLFGHSIYVDSVGLRAGELNGFAVAIMDEIGIDIRGHRAKTFDDLEDTSFDLVITLSPEAHHRALELTRNMACEVEYWKTLDPTFMHGSREVRLDTWRQVRDTLTNRIQQRFGTGPPPRV